MWVFLTRRIREWVLLAVLLPLAARGATSAGRALEQRAGGPTTVSKALVGLGSLGQRATRRGRARGAGRRAPAR